MSRQNIILLISLLVLILLGVGYYLYNKNSTPVTPPVVEQSPSEAKKDELMQFQPDAQNTKSPATVTKELGSFKASSTSSASTTGKAPTKDEKMKSLLDITPESQ